MKSFQSQSGFSLVEALIAFAFLGILALGIATLLGNTFKEQKAISEKMAVLELKNTMMTVLNSSNICYSQINQSNPTLDLSATTTSAPSASTGPKVSLPKLSMGSLPTSPVIAVVGDPLPGFFAGQMMVEKIELNKIRWTGEPNVYVGELEVSIAGSSMVRPLRPASLNMVFTVKPDPSLSTAKILNCGLEGGVGPWVSLLPGTVHSALQDGLLMVTSCDNCGIKMRSGMPTGPSCSSAGTLVERIRVAARDKYGQGVTNATIAVKKDECFIVEMTDKDHNVFNGSANIFFRGM